MTQRKSDYCPFLCTMTPRKVISATHDGGNPQHICGCEPVDCFQRNESIPLSSNFKKFQVG